MKKYKLICLALSLVLLAGCASNDLSEPVFSSGSETNISDHLAATETETSSAKDKDASSQEVKSNSVFDTESAVESSGSDCVPSQPETETRTDTPVSPSEKPNSSPDSTEAPVVESVVTEPSETESTITNQSSESVPEAAPSAIHEPSFDVGACVSYAKNYGQGIGLTLDGSAVSCWDDPIIRHSLLFETADYHNAVFVGYDAEGIARYAAMRGTGSAYKSEVTGSDKHFSFSIPKHKPPNEPEKFVGWLACKIIQLHTFDATQERTADGIVAVAIIFFMSVLFLQIESPNLNPCQDWGFAFIPLEDKDRSRKNPYPEFGHSADVSPVQLLDCGQSHAQYQLPQPAWMF